MLKLQKRKKRAKKLKRRRLCLLNYCRELGWVCPRAYHLPDERHVVVAPQRKEQPQQQPNAVEKMMVNAVQPGGRAVNQ